MIFTALFISYFFPPRLAWPLNLLFVYAYATPLAYDADAIELGYPARLVMFAVAVAGATIAIQFLKGRLVRAELHQRSMAERDPLTGVSNRRIRRRADERRQHGRLLRADPDRPRRLQARQRRAGPSGRRRGAVLSGARGIHDRAEGRLRGTYRRGRVRPPRAPGSGASGVLRLLRDLRDAIDHPPRSRPASSRTTRAPPRSSWRTPTRLMAQKRDGKLRQPL